MSYLGQKHYKNAIKMTIMDFYSYDPILSNIILKGNHCILRILGAPVRQKLGMILGNKVVQKLKLEKMFFTKNGLIN